MAPDVLAHRDLGGCGPLLLILHANGFPGAVYEPLAQALRASYDCISVDFPGQGASPLLPGTPISAQVYADLLEATVRRLGIQGCFCFGHSMGGGIALLLEAKVPGIFAAIYAYEPVARPAAAAHRSAMQRMGWPGQEATTSGPTAAGGSQMAENGVPTAAGGSALARMARKRRWQFESRQQAAQSLAAKPPFSTFDSRALEAYVQHALRPSSSGKGLLLVTDQETEARVFEAFSPPPSIECSRVRCPVAVAVGSGAEEVHSTLVALGEALAAALPAGRLLRMPAGLQHLGPQQQPDTVAASVVHFFRSCSASGAKFVPPVGKGQLETTHRHRLLSRL